MFRGLRLRLTILYLLVALTLVAFVCGGTYTLINAYFQSTADLALQYRMTRELDAINAEIPANLQVAAQTWQSSRVQPARRDDEDEEEEGRDFDADDAIFYDADLASIYVLYLDALGRVIPGRGSLTTFTPDEAAITAAATTGQDLRTVETADGQHVRLLTLSIPARPRLHTIQVGRVLADRDRVLDQLLVVLTSLGGVSALLLGVGSWWLAGRSLAPAQDAWDRQQAFVANASHELRAPLTLMRASAEVVQRELPPDDEERRALLGDVLHECDHMSRLVEDLLLLSRLDSGRLTLAHEPIVLADLLDDVTRRVGRLADERGVHLAIEQAAGSVWADPTRLRQVLLILLDNALKFTPRDGSVRVASVPQGKAVQIDVIDTGCGIAPEHLAHVFERFYRVESTPDDDGSGSGLGLSIARALIEAQHGQIAIDSQPGQGTRVRLTLPAATHDRHARAEQISAADDRSPAAPRRAASRADR